MPQRESYEMEALGWIKIYRDIESHWIFNFKEPDKALAWINLLTMANHADNDFYIKGRLVKCLRGQVAISQLSLQKKWNMSQNKLKRFLILLKKEAMIDFETNDLTTIITICNYSIYQGDMQYSVDSTHTLTDKKSVSNILEKVSFHDSKTNEHKTSISNCNYSHYHGDGRPDERPDERPVERATDDQSNDKQECKNEKNEKNVRIKDICAKAQPKKTSSQTLLAEFGINENLSNDFIAHRKLKKAAITETALKGFQREADKAKISLSEAITYSIERGWVTFKNDWYQNAIQQTQPQNKETVYEQRKRERDSWGFPSSDRKTDDRTIDITAYNTGCLDSSPF
jgi:hypothetical protein